MGGRRVAGFVVGFVASSSSEFLLVGLGFDDVRSALGRALERWQEREKSGAPMVWR